MPVINQSEGKGGKGGVGGESVTGIDESAMGRDESQMVR